MTISVIIPTLNEASCIQHTLRSLQCHSALHEVIVADGGSADGTRRLAARHARVVTARRGRAHQMNTGAAQAAGDVLLFLHADTTLPPDALTAVRQTLAVPGSEAGTFRLRFDEPTPLLRFYAFCTRLPLPHICFGDRALFVERSVFDEVGRYPEIPIFEDLELAAKLYRRDTFRFLPQSVTTSARRFHRRGVVRQQLHNAFLWTSYQLGIRPSWLAPLYRYPISE